MDNKLFKAHAVLTLIDERLNDDLGSTWVDRIVVRQLLGRRKRAREVLSLKGYQLPRRRLLPSR